MSTRMEEKERRRTERLQRERSEALTATGGAGRRPPRRRSLTGMDDFDRAEKNVKRFFGFTFGFAVISSLIMLAIMIVGLVLLVQAL